MGEVLTTTTTWSRAHELTSVGMLGLGGVAVEGQQAAAAWGNVWETCAQL